MDKIEITHKAFEIMNDLKKKHDWDVMVQNSHDVMGLDIGVQALENILIESDLYTWDKEKQKYILKDK